MARDSTYRLPHDFSGKKLGTAQMFIAARGDDLGFCVWIGLIKPLRR